MGAQDLPWRSPERPLSEHLRLEVAHAHDRAHKPGDPPPLGPTDPVPGCGCPSCLTLAAGGTWEDADLAEDLVQMLAGLPPEERVGAIEEIQTESKGLGHGWRLPSPGVLALLAATVPGAVLERRGNGRVRPGAGGREESLPVEEARSADILALSHRLGLGEPVRRGREYAVRCPFHDDERPSLRLNMNKGTWYCDVCAEGGDGIALVERARGLSFADAVREIAR